MKLNATSEMFPVSWPEFGGLHPFAPAEQTRGYQKLFRDLEAGLAEITGFAACRSSRTPASQGEYAGLLVIRAYHESRGQGHRNACLIPTSAHGTNPASRRDVRLHRLPSRATPTATSTSPIYAAKAAEHAHDLAAVMVTYPSTHGVFEDSIKDICAIVHEHGGQVYMDGSEHERAGRLTSPGHSAPTSVT